MWLLFAAAGFFGTLTNAGLPLTMAGKQLNAFDAAFAVLLVGVTIGRRWRSPDAALVAGCALWVLAAFAAFRAHPSPGGAHEVLVLAYSLTVFLLAAHMSASNEESKRAIVAPVVAAVGLAWLMLPLENILQQDIGDNTSKALPAGLHRLGGLTGGNPLALFLAVATPFFSASPTAFLGLLASGFATLSRSLTGIGSAWLVQSLQPGARVEGASRLRVALAVIAVASGLLVYAFSPAAYESPASPISSFGLRAGGYPVLHAAAVRMTIAHPFTGIGPGRFGDELRNFTTLESLATLPGVPGAIAWDPHGAVTGLAAEQGLPGLIAFVVLIAITLRRLNLAADEDARWRSFAALTGLLTAGLFLDWFALKAPWLWLGLLVSAARGDRLNPGRA